MTLQNSTFTHNVAQAGAGGDGGFRRIGRGRQCGDGLYQRQCHDHRLDLRRRSEGFGGSGGTGADGGAGGTGGFSGAMVWSTNMTVSNSTFTGNLAIAGTGRAGPVPAAMEDSGESARRCDLRVYAVVGDREHLPRQSSDRRQRRSWWREVRWPGRSWPKAVVSTTRLLRSPSSRRHCRSAPSRRACSWATSRSAAGGNGSQGGDGGDGGLGQGGDIIFHGYLSITSSSFLFTKALGGAGGAGATGRRRRLGARRQPATARWLV